MCDGSREIPLVPGAETLWRNGQRSSPNVSQDSAAACQGNSDIWRVASSSVGVIPSGEPDQSSVPNDSENIGMVPKGEPGQPSVTNNPEHMPQMSVSSTPMDVHEEPDHSIVGAQVSTPRASNNSDLQRAEACWDIIQQTDSSDHVPVLATMNAVNHHPMITRIKVGVFKHKVYHASVTGMMPIPATIQEAMQSTERELYETDSGLVVIVRTMEIDDFQTLVNQVTATEPNMKAAICVSTIILGYVFGDKVFLQVSPWKKVLRFGKKRKLSPRYISPFEVIEKVGSEASRLALPPKFHNIHNVFHVSMLRRYRSDPSHVLELEEVEFDSNLLYKEEVVQNFDREVNRLRNKNFSLVKAIWINHKVEEAMWESEETMRTQYSYLFDDGKNSRTNSLLRGESCHTLKMP
ncbi:hypothetical protein GQ457_05G022990 [Hibiscus cannabinus]